jgi:hypothetical protein
VREERHTVEAAQTAIQTLGPAQIVNPMLAQQGPGSGYGRFVDETVRVRVDPFLHEIGRAHV